MKTMKEFDEIIKGNEEMNRPTNERILNFLTQNRNFAFEYFDLFAALKPNLAKKFGNLLFDGVRVVELIRFSIVLDELEKEGKIRKACQGEETYYTIV